jgi:hypothetical protein
VNTEIIYNPKGEGNKCKEWLLGNILVNMMAKVTGCQEAQNRET